MKLDETLAKIVEYANENNLPMKGPWTLDSDVAADLTDTFDYTPPGGWSPLIELSCGFGLFKTTDDQFTPRYEPEVVRQEDPDEIKVQLVESYTRKLIPPSIAAGTFIFAGVHPVWGLRLAKKVQAERHFTVKIPPKFSDTTEEVLDNLREYLFDTMTQVVTYLSTADNPVQIDDFDEFLEVLLRQTDVAGSVGLDDVDREYDPELAVPVNSDGQIERAVTTYRESIIDEVLVPSQIATYDEDSSELDVDQDLLSEVRVE